MSNHILIVGGSSGIGLATAKRFFELGWRVTIAGRTKERLDAAKLELGEAEGILFDAADLEETHDALRSLAGLTAIVTTAGSDAGGSMFADAGAGGIVEAVGSKAGAQLAVLEAALRTQHHLSSFIFVSGAAARKGGPGMAPLTAANAAIEALVPVLAKELAPLRINAVSPGFVETPLYAGMPKTDRDQLIGEMAKATPTGKIATAEDVADAIWIAATNASINGAVLPVDGGV